MPELASRTNRTSPNLPPSLEILNPVPQKNKPTQKTQTENPNKNPQPKQPAAAESETLSFSLINYFSSPIPISFFTFPRGFHL
jgi:hypothetical protein